MKKIIQLLLLLSIAVVIFVKPSSLTFDDLNQLISYSPCENPVTFKVDKVDPQFKITKNEFIRITQEAAGKWNKAAGKKLLSFNSQGVLSINLIFDERQSLRSNVYKLKQSIEEDQNNLKPTIQEFDNLKIVFEKRLNELNRQIEEWNKKGGAPEEEYNRLLREQDDLKIMADKLNAMARDLNQSALEYNTKINNLKEAVNSYNLTVHTKPEGGIYDPNRDRIEIYFGDDREELKSILMHEMGHALGLVHSPNSKSVMYSKSVTGKNQITEGDVKALNLACQPKSIFTLFKERVRIMQAINFKNPS